MDMVCHRSQHIELPKNDRKRQIHKKNRHRTDDCEIQYRFAAKNSTTKRDKHQNQIDLQQIT